MNADVKDKMKSLKAGGKTLAQISKAMFDQGVKTSSGKPLGVSYISKLITESKKTARRAKRVNATVAAASPTKKEPGHLVELLDGILNLKTTSRVKAKLVQVALEAG